MKPESKRVLKPKRRFPEFQDAGSWDVDGLSNVADFVSERIRLERIGVGNYVSTENILPDFSGVTTASKLPTTGSATRFTVHDILVSNIRPYLKKVWLSDKMGGASNDVIVIRAKQIVSSQYLPFILKNDSFIAYVMRGAKGVKMPRGDVALMGEYPVVYPSIPEQQKIAECLTSLDELIAAHGQKLDALKAHKKGLMQQLFPCEGETIPRLRFPEFRDSVEWHSDSVGEIFETSSGGTPSRSTKEYWNGGVPWVTTSLVDFGLISKAEEFISPKGLEASSAKLFPKGTILIAMIGQGKTRGKVAMLGIEAATNQNCAAILPRIGIEASFVFANLANRYEEIRELGNRGGQGSLSQALVRDIPFAFPKNIAEQKRIIDCLNPLAELIAAQEQKMAAQTAFKSALMQQLFPFVCETEK